MEKLVLAILLTVLVITAGCAANPTDNRLYLNGDRITVTGKERRTIGEKYTCYGDVMYCRSYGSGLECTCGERRALDPLF
jgi:hypothetical protein